MEPIAKSAEELAAETWPDEGRMGQADPVELTLDEALAIMGGKEGGGDGD